MSKSTKTVISNVRIFDGSETLSPLTSLVIQGDKIVTNPEGADKQVDGQGGTLLPGFIDGHVHVSDQVQLEKMARYGITTALDMACWPSDFVNSLRTQRGVTDFRSAGLCLTSPGSSHSKIPSLPQEAQVVGPTEARQFVSRRVAEGSDYIKLIADVPGPDQEILNAAAEEASALGKCSVAHAVTKEAWKMAQAAKVDVITHAPLNGELEDVYVEDMLNGNRICIPTLTMMEHSRRGRPGFDVGYCKKAVSKMHRAGVPILVGTDANDTPGSHFSVMFGESFHQELQLLVESGLSNLDALRAGTISYERYFDLGDRCVIAPGRRADLVLIDGDPVQDIGATKNIRKVWCAGIEVI